MEVLEALDAAIATALQARREKLLRIAAGKEVRVRVAYTCTAFITICAVASLFSGDQLAAAIIGVQACLLTGVVFVSTLGARRKALRELQEMKLSAIE